MTVGDTSRFTVTGRRPLGGNVGCANNARAMKTTEALYLSSFIITIAISKRSGAFES